jgi:hypothetical protein
VPNLLSPQDLFDYQRECVLHQLYNDDSMLWLGMGLGKTPITLTTIVDRMRAGQVQKTLIFGPLRVIQAVWAREARKWEHTEHLRFSVMHGNKEKRTRAMFANADIFLCNYENMNWLTETLDHYYISQGKEMPFQMVVYDEVSKMKNSTSMRMGGGFRERKDSRGEVHRIKRTGWRKMIPHFKYRTGLTGTPASNGYIDLHGQYLAVDGGKRLGEYVTGYKDNYFTSDHMGWAFSPTAIGKQWIEHNISDITKKMDAKDYLDLPECKITNIMVDLPPVARKTYDEMEKNMFSKLDNGSELEVFSRNSVSNKCLQICNGSAYLPDSKEWEKVHDAKLDALEEVLEEAGGSPVLCSYSFRADAERIMKRFKKYKPVNMTATKSSDTEAVINKWNSGQIKLMIGHPACLHPDTQVLTERDGWVRIVDVQPDDRVHDGTEFVSHDGCSYAGYKEVIDVFGVTMTLDHKVLIDDEWVEAQHVDVSEDGWEKAKWEGDPTCTDQMRLLQTGTDDQLSKYGQTQQDGVGSLHIVQVPPHDWDSDLANMARCEAPNVRHDRQELCGSWDRNVQRMEPLQYVLHGYDPRLFGRSDDRASGREQIVQQGELYLGDTIQTTGQQAHQPRGDLSREAVTPCRTVSGEWVQQDHVTDATQPRTISRRGSEGCTELTLREEPKHEGRDAKRESEVYDLVNCGPRHRFLVKNDEGKMFIVKNSMGHGVDGLQDSGHILVWFGLNWSLELYEQMIGRIDRQGQKHPVSLIRILCNDTVDLAVADALSRKTDDQEGLKAALQRYRDGHTTNELEINFM